MPKIASAPISWGVCAVPGWGRQLPSEQVLDEMQQLGIQATELGNVGFLPDEPEAARAMLESRGMTPVGTYHGLVLHDPTIDWRDELEERLSYVRRAGASHLALALHDRADTDYGVAAPEIGEQEWQVLVASLDEVHRRARARGVTVALHPHIGTLAFRPQSIERIVAESTIPFCIDTGHGYVGGNDPLELIDLVGERLAMLHLKDVSAEVAARLDQGLVSFLDAIREGLFLPLGDGCLDVEAILTRLRDMSFEGWIVLEQDIAFDTEPEPGRTPKENVAKTLETLSGFGFA